MKLFFTTAGAARPSRHCGALGACLFALALVFSSAPALAEKGELSKETTACLKCHDKEGEVKALENGEKLSLHVSTQAFVGSMHKDTECEDCHSNIDAKTHGKVPSSIKSLRDFSMGMRESCREGRQQGRPQGRALVLDLP